MDLNARKYPKALERTKLITLTEWAAIILVMYYCAACFYDSCTYNFSFFDNVSRKITVALPLASMALIRFGIVFLKNLKAAKTKKQKLFLYLKLPLMAICALPCFIVAYKFDYVSFAYIACAVFCLYGIDKDRVLKAFVATIGTALCAVILSSLAGVIPNYVYQVANQNRSNLLRASYGIIYPTDFASYFFFLILFIWGSLKNRNTRNILTLSGFSILVIGFINYFANSNTSTFCIILSVVFMLYELLESKILANHNKTKWIPKAIGSLSVLAFPLLGLVFWIMTFLYGKGNNIALKVNDWGHNRLYYTWLSYEKYGIHPFGAITPQHGYGGGDILGYTEAYEFLDSSYALMLIRYGWVLTLILTALWIWMTIRALKSGRRSLVFSMALIAVHAFSEHHVPELNYNILLAMPLCTFSADAPQTIAVKRAAVPNKNVVWIPAATGTAVAALCIWKFQSFLSRARTVFELKNWRTGSDKSFIALVSIIALIGTVVLFWRSITRLILILSYSGKRKSVMLKALSGLLIAVGFMTAGYIWSDTVIDSGMAGNSSVLAEESDALNVIVSAAEQPVYCAFLEELHKRQFPEISDMVGTPEELCRQRRGTLISEREPEVNKLISTGAIYAEISDHSGVYTYDSSVINALRNAGYTVHGYYYSERELDNEWLSAHNGLQTNELGGILLTADHPALTQEPYLSLYGGDYQTVFDLWADRTRMPQDGAVCMVEVTTYEGEKIIVQQEVMPEEFDSFGHLNLELNYKIGSSAGVSFNVRLLSDTTLTVNRISWRRNPASDTWRTYSDKGLVLTERYYDLDGKPLATNDGYYGLNYEYDDGNNNWTHVVYLDQNGSIMCKNNGCAQIRRSFNDDNQVIYERFYDTEGNPVAVNHLYACVHYEYIGTARSLTYYYDLSGNVLSMGSSNLHEYLQSLTGGDRTIFIAIKDEGTGALTPTIIEDLSALGAKINLTGKSKNSYYAVLSPNGSIEDISASSSVSRTGSVGGVDYSIFSAGADTGNDSSIVINGTEYSKNVRGLNIVVVENGTVVDSVGFDTYSQEIIMTR